MNDIGASMIINCPMYVRSQQDRSTRYGHVTGPSIGIFECRNFYGAAGESCCRGTHFCGSVCFGISRKT